MNAVAATAPANAKELFMKYRYSRIVVAHCHKSKRIEFRTQILAFYLISVWVLQTNTLIFFRQSADL